MSSPAERGKVARSAAPEGGYLSSQNVSKRTQS
jgi:hypothetical protein